MNATDVTMWDRIDWSKTSPPPLPPLQSMHFAVGSGTVHCGIPKINQYIKDITWNKLEDNIHYMKNRKQGFVSKTLELHTQFSKSWSWRNFQILESVDYRKWHFHSLLECISNIFWNSKWKNNKYNLRQYFWNWKFIFLF